jgi:uncharacterized protein (DUF488 family)
VKPVIVTIGVYGFTAEQFLQALLAAQVDTFCDLRGRRGMRGSSYAFANSERLQHMLQEQSIRYVHLKDLAPSVILREVQKLEDKKRKEQKRAREQLAPAFIEQYKQMHLADFDASAFLRQLGGDTQVLALFCVEREAAACHRSLVAACLAQAFDLSIRHIVPV